MAKRDTTRAGRGKFCEAHEQGRLANRRSIPAAAPNTPSDKKGEARRQAGPRVMIFGHRKSSRDSLIAA